MDLIERLKVEIRRNPKRIVFPEGEDRRIIKATKQMLEQKIVCPVLLGGERLIKELCRKEDINPDKIEIIDPTRSNDLQDYFKTYIDLAKPNAVITNKIRKQLTSPLYYGAVMTKIKKVDGLVAGAANTSSDVIRACLSIIRPLPDVSTVSGFFVMDVPDCNYGNNGVFIFADTGIIPNPTSSQLADIAIASAQSARQLLCCEPKVALLSFSTKGSSRAPMANKVVEAVKIVKESKPDLMVDGELQMDAALVPEVAAIKAPESKVAGYANVLIFPDLNAGNITYKAVERLAKAQACGPLFQGLSRPASDLSRGCSVRDIVDTTAFVVLQAQLLDNFS